MSAAIRVALALVLAPAVLAAQTPAASPQATFPSGTELVTVDVVVVDGTGRPVAGLTQADFTVLENGQPRAIESFERVELPEAPEAPAPAERPRASVNTAAPPARTFVIVFDEAHLTPATADRAKEAIERFLREEARPGDRVTLAPTGGGAWWSDTLPEGRDDLLAVLRKMDGRAPRVTGSDHVTDWEAMRIHVFRDDRVAATVQRRFFAEGATPDYLPGVAGTPAPDFVGEGHPVVKLRAAEVYANSVARRRATLRTLDAVLESLVGAKGRKAVLLVSEGFVHEPSLVEVHRVYDAARRANTAVHFVDARGLFPVDSTVVEGGRLTQASGSRGSASSNDLGLSLDQARFLAEGTDAVAAETGGQSFKNTNDVSRAFDRLSRESGVYYLVGYAPADNRRDGKFRRIDVRVSRPGVEVRARRGYVLPREKDLQERVADRRDPKLPAPPPPAPDASTLPLRLSAFAMGETADGKVRVIVAGEAAASSFVWEKSGDRFEDALDTTVSVAPRGGTDVKTDTRVVELSLPAEMKAQVEEGWMPVLREFDLSPGVYQARVVVRERNGGRVGTVRHTFEVPAAGMFRMTTPVLTDMMQPGPGGLARPSLLARRTFARGGRLFAQFEMVNAARDDGGAPRVLAGHTLRRADGTVLSQQAPTPLPPDADGRLSRTLSITLRTAAPGSHELVLTARDEISGRTWETVEPFEVADPERAAALGAATAASLAGAGHGHGAARSAGPLISDGTLRTAAARRWPPGAARCEPARSPWSRRPPRRPVPPARSARRGAATAAR